MINLLPTEISQILKSACDGGDNNLVMQELMKRTSTNIMQSAEKFEGTVKRDRSIMVNISIDQNEKVGELIERVRKMPGIKLIGNRKVDDVDVDLTKFIVYVLKDSKKQAITCIFDKHHTLAEIGVMDRQ